MRTTQDRINLLLSHFGMDRILENVLNEDLIFCKGAAFSSQNPHEMKPIAKFGFNSKSTRNVNHWFFKPSHTVFKQAFHKIENDETKYLQIELDDFYGLIHEKNDRKNKMMFVDNLPIFEAIGKMAGGKMSRFFVNEYFEEFEGVVSHSYEVMVDIGEYGNTGFNALTADLANDELFLVSVQHFIKKYCKSEVSIDELKTDLIGSISKFRMHEDVFTTYQFGVEDYS